MKVHVERKTPASIGIALATMRKAGLAEIIDSYCEFDKNQRKLTPGEVALLLIGLTFYRTNRIPLCRVRNYYEKMNLKRILGRDVDIESLNDNALGRGLETIHKADTANLVWEISKRFEIDADLVSTVFHLDQTKIRTYLDEEPGALSGVPNPQFGIDKEGRTDFVIYSANSLTDEHRVIRYLKADDGAKTDAQQDKEAIDFLKESVDPSRSTIVADSKCTNAELTTIMDEYGFGFVTKVPDNFSSRMQDRISTMAFNDGWASSSELEGHEFFEVTMKTSSVDSDGNALPMRDFRYIAFRTSKMFDERRAELLRKGSKAAEKAAAGLRKERFESPEEAMLRVSEYQESILDTGHSLKWCLFPYWEEVKREGRGRPRKGDHPSYKKRWKVLCAPVVDSEWADVLTDMACCEVLVTNIPRTECEEDPRSVADARDGASSEKVLELYKSQYKQEHTFSLLKGKIWMNRLFLESRERVDGMVTVLGIAAALRNIMDHRFRTSKGRIRSSYDMIELLQLVTLRSDDGEIEIYGDERSAGILSEAMRRLGLDEGMVEATV